MNPGSLGFRAFTSSDFRSVFGLEEIWEDRPCGHVPLHAGAFRRFQETLNFARRAEPNKNRLGLCFIGPAGAGKSHFLGEIRREAATCECNFVLSDLTDVRDFWSLLAIHYLKSVHRRMNGVRQLEKILDVLFFKPLRDVGDPLATVSSVGEVLLGCRSYSREKLLRFGARMTETIAHYFPNGFTERSRVFRALVYLESSDYDLADRAFSFLQGIEQIDAESRKIGLSGPNSPKKIASHLAWFLALVGPTVLAFDQLDPFVSQNGLGELTSNPGPREREAIYILNGFVNGIFAIFDEFPRTLTVVTCLETSWKVLQRRYVESFQQRFQPPETLGAVEGPDGVSIVRGRLSAAFEAASFVPPYPAWPFGPKFFEAALGKTPREILNRCEEHRRACAKAGDVIEWGWLDESRPTDVPPGNTTPAERPLDAIYQSACNEIDPTRLLSETHEDELGGILAKAAELFCRELPLNANIDYAVDKDFEETRSYRSLHFRIRRILRDRGDLEEHACFRVLQKRNATAFQSRLTAALTSSGVSEHLEGRCLFLIRNGSAPSGKRTKELLDEATDYGARFVNISEEAIRTIAAIVRLSERGDPMFEGWLLERRKLSSTALFRMLVPGWITGAPAPRVQTEPRPRTEAPETAATIASHPPASPPLTVVSSSPAMPPRIASSTAGILLGRRSEAGSLGEPVLMPVVDLTKHVIIRAGSGSGKTVFVKRLVEEAALAGVSSIVIDVARDLTRLGEPWPEPPAAWSARDHGSANRYFADVDVHILTPGHRGGRPVRLGLLPNLAGPFDTPEEAEQIVDIAVAGLMSMAVKKKNATVEKAVLTAVVKWLARSPRDPDTDAKRLVLALRDMPAEAIQGYQNERRLAAAMADEIQAARDTDPLYGGSPDAEDLDPAALLSAGSRPRVSVLSLFALQAIESQARFIGQLSVSLFNWIRRNPIPDGAQIRGLLVLDEAARFLPRHNAESKPGLLLLAAQARKYGLGLVLATQNPMDLDYNATANFSTHLFGTAHQPQVVRHIQDALEQKGLPGVHPGQLKVGEFYCATPSVDRPFRLKTPLCLSFHPNNVQLTDDEILQKAIGSKEKSHCH